MNPLPRRPQQVASPSLPYKEEEAADMVAAAEVEVAEEEEEVSEGTIKETGATLPCLRAIPTE